MSQISTQSIGVSAVARIADLSAEEPRIKPECLHRSIPLTFKTSRIKHRRNGVNDNRSLRDFAVSRAQKLSQATSTILQGARDLKKKNSIHFTCIEHTSTATKLSFHSNKHRCEFRQSESFNLGGRGVFLAATIKTHISHVLIQ